MCNPRRIEVRATRSIAEAWEREVRRMASRIGVVRGETRIRQSLEGTIGAPALAALERALMAGTPGWVVFGDVYRYDVAGGYALYAMADRSLTIVAMEEEEIVVEQRVATQISGRVDDVITGSGVGTYYDDRYGGTSPEQAAAHARLAAENMVAGVVQQRIEQEVSSAESSLGPELQAEAERRAQVDYEARFATRSTEIQREVEARAVAIGAEVRRGFHSILARAYRDALLALARHRGAETVRCTEDGDMLEIEIMLPR